MTARPTSAALRTLPLFADVAPGLVLPRPKLVSAPRGQLTLFPLPEPTRPRVRLALVDPRQVALFPALAPRPTVRLPRSHVGQLVMPLEPEGDPRPRRHLTLVVPYRGCEAQASSCVQTHCRYHLAEGRPLEQVPVRCGLQVATLGAWSPVMVAALLGISEREVQRIEKTALSQARRAGRDEWDDLYVEMFDRDPADEDDAGDDWEPCQMGLRF